MKRRNIHLGLVVIAWVALSPPAAPAQTTRSYEGVDAISFQRSAGDVLQGLNRAAPGKTPTPVDQFRADFLGGNWAAIAASLKEMPPALSARVYDKMLGDLVSKGEPFMLLDDVLGLAKANPGDWTAGRLKQLGLLVKACVPAMQRRWLQQHLDEGVAGLGGKDPAARLAAGRMLIHAQFSEMATRFLPKAEEARDIADAGARAEVLAFYSIKLETEQVEQTRQPPALAQHLEVLKNPASPPAKVRQSMTFVVRQVGLLSPAAIDAAIGTLIRENPPVAQELLVETLKQYRLASTGRAFGARLNHLYAIGALAATVAAAKGEEPSWKQLLQLMADHWTQEADNTFSQRGVRTGPPVSVDAQEMVATAPSGQWLAALPAPMAEKIEIAVARCVITAGDFDSAATLIVNLSKRNADAALALADDFLVAWGDRNNPDLPEPLRKKFALPEDAHIAITPVMMAKNIRNLARIMTLFREAGVAWKDNARIVAAFDAAYGNAEAYHLSHIEQVFGSVDQMSEGLVLQMMTRMRDSLGGRWRKMEVQQANLTRRNEGQTLQMVRDGYTAALQIADAWLAKNRDGYRAGALAGTLLNDWADFEYFQQLVTTEGPARMATFKDKQGLAQEHFAQAAKAYARVAPALASGDYTVDPYVAWFNSLLGINSNGDINLSKPMNRAALERIRDAIRALPGKAAEAHVGLFARYVSGRMQSATSPLHEELKYKFLAGSLIITQDNPFTLQARKQVDYYDQLLSEIRLRTSIDGPTTVGRDQDFGVVLSVVHTESMGRMAKFGQYLTNAQPAEVTARRARDARNPLLPHPLRMTEVQGPRDQLELSIREALDPFFDIRSITFSRADVAPRKTDQPGWQETVLAYIHLRVKDASVDRVPPVEMDLSFLDLSGPVTIPARSAETLLKVSSSPTPPRPAEKIEVVETLDPRQFTASGGLTLQVKATAIGLVPEFDDILDLGPLRAAVEVSSVAAHGGALVKELHSWGEKVTAVSQREWTVVMDGIRARDAGQTVTLEYPTARRPDVTISRQTYDDMNLVPVKGSSVVVGRASGGVVAPPPRRDWVWMVSGGAALAVLALAGLLALRGARHRQAPAARARDVFKMPRNVDGFVVVRLLRRLAGSPLAGFEPAERAAVQQDIERVEQAVFAPGAAGLSDGELRDIAGKWLARLN